MNIPIVELFQQRLAMIHDIADISNCFPYQVLETEAPIALFYAFYGV